MAGSYPDLPGRRLAWDADGTIVWRVSDTSAGTAWTNVNPNSIVVGVADMDQGNNETEDVWVSEFGQPGVHPYSNFCHIFPSPRDIDGWYWGFDIEEAGAGIYAVQYSQDSTNGIDGTWVNLTNPAIPPSTWTNEVYYRLGIETQSVSAARCLRWVMYSESDLTGRTMYLHMVHLYGAITPGYVPDQVLFVDASSGLEFATDYDWGDVPRGTTLERTFKIKNNSSTKTANNTVVDVQSLSGSSNTWYTLKLGAGSFQSSITITTLTAGSSSDTITLRLTVPSGGALSLGAARVRAIPTTWT